MATKHDSPYIYTTTLSPLFLLCQNYTHKACENHSTMGKIVYLFSSHNSPHWESSCSTLYRVHIFGICRSLYWKYHSHVWLPWESLAINIKIHHTPCINAKPYLMCKSCELVSSNTSSFMAWKKDKLISH